jgi:polysaccharide biosynthesis/export protein
LKPIILFFIALVGVFPCPFLPGQNIFDELEQTEELNPEERISLAISNENYSVTPGDIYQLNYQPAEEIMTIYIPVETDYSLNLGILGNVAGYGLTFPQLKQKIESKFSAAYPQSTPSLTIYSLSRFQVFLSGEVPQAKFVNAWGLTRLGEVLKGNTGPYSSIRHIEIKTSKGKTHTYDLFKGVILGDPGHNPFVKAGDTVIVSRRNKQIQLQGEIFRPGTYEILTTDTMADIINIYGGSFTEQANTDYLRIERTINNTLELFTYKNIAEKNANSLLFDRDIVNVEEAFKEIPVVFIEGAVKVMDQETEDAAGEPGDHLHNLFVQPFFTGDTVYDVMSKVKDSLVPAADLASSYVIRAKDNETIPVNLQALLYNHDLSHNHKIENFDRIIIPRKRIYVIVSGDVQDPGNYSYVPDQKYTYYLGRAGGIVNGGIEENTTFIIDKEGNYKTLEEDIAAGDMIVLKRATVIVSGAVTSPGEYLYVPGKLYYYYVNLAGGINYDRNDGCKIIIRDSGNNKKGKKDTINPGDTIFIPSSGFSYNFNKYISVVATSLSIIVSSILIWNEFAP